MTDISTNLDEKQTGDFNALSFERKLVELVEELRLRRNLEVESEKTLLSLMDEKYQQELSWDEQIKRHGRERESLEQQIELLKRKLEDRVCVSDEDKAKQQVMNKTYSHEIRMLKEELRMSKSEKLILQKKIQELEGKLKLHNTFQESILNQVCEVQKMMKTIFEECKELTAKQKNVMENVASAKSMFNKYDLINQHLQQCIVLMGRKSEAFKQELIKSRSEVTFLKQSVPSNKDNNNYVLELEKLQNKVLNLENLLLLSRKENEKTLNNFLESNKLLCKFMDKFSEIQEKEKQLSKEHELLQGKLHESQIELQKTKDEIKEIEQKTALKDKERLENQCTTENILYQSCFCSKSSLKPFDDKVIAADSSFISEIMDENLMDEGLIELQQKALMMQSVNSGINSVSLDQLCINSADKRITLSQVLKRKLEIMESGDKIQLITMKKRFTENNTTARVVNGLEAGSENNMLIPDETKDLNTDTSLSHLNNKMPISHGVGGCNNLTAVHLPLGIKSEMMISHDKPLCNFNVSVNPSSDLNEYMASDQPLCNNSNLLDLKSKLSVPHQPLDNLNPDFSESLSSGSNKNGMLVSTEASHQWLCNINPPSDVENTKTND